MQDKPFQPLWGTNIPGQIKTDGVETDITKPGEGLVMGKRVARIANVSVPGIAVYAPPKSKQNGAAVVVCPGGGFSILAMDLEGTEVATWLNSIGVTAIVLKYRVPTGSFDPNWLGPTMDAQRAISVTRQNAKEWGIDPTPIGRWPRFQVVSGFTSRRIILTRFPAMLTLECWCTPRILSIKIISSIRK